MKQFKYKVGDIVKLGKLKGFEDIQGCELEIKKVNISYIDEVTNELVTFDYETEFYQGKYGGGLRLDEEDIEGFA